MKADFYTGFLTDKVKVFGTSKGSKPFTVRGRVLRKAAPFLLASALAITACGPRQDDDKTRKDKAESIDMRAIYADTACGPHQDDDKTSKNKAESIDMRAIYAEVVDKYNLTELKDKEPLSEAEIRDLLENPNAPALKDKNFNHLPENNANFWEIVRNGLQKTKDVQKSPNIAQKLKTEYKITAYKMLSQISRIKGTQNEVDLSDYNNLKTFLYFEKVIEYGDQYAKVFNFNTGAGRINEQDEIFGRYYKDYEALKQKAKSYPGVEKFARALYNTEEQYLISYADSAKANAISMDMLDDWLKKTEIKDNELFYFTDVTIDDNANKADYFYKRGSQLHVMFGIDKNGNLGKGYFSSIGTIGIHELQHVMQKKPASAEKPSDNRRQSDEYEEARFETGILSELGPTLYSLMMEDRIYKKIHGIAADKVLDYGDIDLGYRKVSLGETAVWFGKMIEKYPHNSVDKLLQEDEVIRQLDRWGSRENANAYRRERNSGR